jgi:hypothetical protein
MKPTSLAAILALAASVMMASFTRVGHAQDGIDKATADAFDSRMFAGAPGQKSYACFVRHYDSDHMAHHPKQKVTTMKLLMTAEIPSDEKVLNYSFRLGVKYRNRSGNFDSSGGCGHAVFEDAGNEVRFGCGVDCDGGGIGVALSKDDKSAIVRLERVRIWQRNKPTKKPAMIWSPAPTTGFSVSIASIRANAPSS